MGVRFSLAGSFTAEVVERVSVERSGNIRSGDEFQCGRLAVDKVEVSHIIPLVVVEIIMSIDVPNISA